MLMHIYKIYTANWLTFILAVSIKEGSVRALLESVAHSAAHLKLLDI
jgi:hypothetical protein